MIMNSIWVYRKLLNADDVLRAAEKAGFDNLYEPEKMHITVAYHKEQVDTNKLEIDNKRYSCFICSGRWYSLFDRNHFVMEFTSPFLKAQHHKYKLNGLKWDYEDFKPHVSISNVASQNNLDAEAYKSNEVYDGFLYFSEEIYQEIDNG